MGPDDPIGTVRAGDGTLAVRAPSTSIDAELGSDTDLSWFIIDIGGDIHEDDVLLLLDTWPIVYQP
jgi:hypothetical protein